MILVARDFMEVYLVQGGAQPYLPEPKLVQLQVLKLRLPIAVLSWIGKLQPMLKNILFIKVQTILIFQN